MNHESLSYIESKFSVNTECGIVIYSVTRENYPFGSECIYSASVESKSVSIRIQLDDDGSLNLNLPIYVNIVKKNNIPLTSFRYTMDSCENITKVLSNPFRCEDLTD